MFPQVAIHVGRVSFPRRKDIANPMLTFFMLVTKETTSRIKIFDGLSTNNQSFELSSVQLLELGIMSGERPTTLLESSTAQRPVLVLCARIPSQFTAQGTLITSVTDPEFAIFVGPALIAASSIELSIGVSTDTHFDDASTRHLREGCFTRFKIATTFCWLFPSSTQCVVL
jgi:hypothetical protein